MRSENFWPWLAQRMPRKLVYWCAIRLMAHATTGRYSTCCPDRVTILQALDRWNRK